MGQYTVKVAASEEEQNAVYAFRFEHYAAGLGETVPGADREKKLLVEDHDRDASHFYAVDEQGDIAAVLSQNPVDRPSRPPEWHDWLQLNLLEGLFDPKQIAVTTRLIAKPGPRAGSALGSLLLSAFEEQARSGVLCSIFCCSPAMIEVCQHLGYRLYTGGFAAEGSHSLPMVLLLDPGRLTTCRSPFCEIAKRYFESCPDEAAQAARFLMDNAPEYFSTDLPAVMKEDALWSSLADGVLQREAELFGGLCPDTLESMVGDGALLLVGQGDRIGMRTEEAVARAFLVTDGVFRMEATAGDKKLYLGLLVPGDVLDVTDGSESDQRTVNALALSEGRVLALGDPLMAFLQKADPGLGFDLMAKLVGVLCQRLTHSSELLGTETDRYLFRDCELFRGLGAPEIDFLWDQFPMCRFEPTEAVMKKGDVSREAYLIVDGEVHVQYELIKEGKKGDAPLRPTVAKMGPGDIIGEFALIDGEPRQADVLAAKPTRALRIDANVLERMYREDPDLGLRLQQNLSQILVARIRQTSEQLAGAIEWGWKAHGLSDV